MSNLFSFILHLLCFSHARCELYCWSGLKKSPLFGKTVHLVYEVLDVGREPEGEQYDVLDGVQDVEGELPQERRDVQAWGIKCITYVDFPDEKMQKITITWSLSVHELEVFPRAVLGVADLDARDGGSGALVLSGGGKNNSKCKWEVKVVISVSRCFDFARKWRISTPSRALIFTIWRIAREMQKLAHFKNFEFLCSKI